MLYYYCSLYPLPSSNATLLMFQTSFDHVSLILEQQLIQMVYPGQTIQKTKKYKDGCLKMSVLIIAFIRFWHMRSSLYESAAAPMSDNVTAPAAPNVACHTKLNC